MNLLDLIAQGAVLTVNLVSGAKMLLGPVAEIHAGRLLFYDLTSDRARTLKFDALEWPHELGAWLIEHGDRIAYLTLAAEDSPEALAAWKIQWADQPVEEQNRLREMMTEQVVNLRN